MAHTAQPGILPACGLEYNSGHGGDGYKENRPALPGTRPACGLEYTSGHSGNGLGCCPSLDSLPVLDLVYHTGQQQGLAARAGTVPNDSLECNAGRLVDRPAPPSTGPVSGLEYNSGRYERRLGGSISTPSVATQPAGLVVVELNAGSGVLTSAVTHLGI